jgi:hypothetical protein
MTPHQKHARAQLLQDIGAHPSAIMDMLIRVFGHEILTWDSRTIWEEIEDEFGIAAPPQTENKIQAMRTILTTLVPWRRWDIFAHVAQALSGQDAIFEEILPPTVPRVMYAIDTMRRASPEQEFSEEVKKAIAAALFYEGYVYVGKHALSPHKYLVQLGADPELLREIHSARVAGTPAPSVTAQLQIERALGLDALVAAYDKRLLADQKKAA